MKAPKQYFSAKLYKEVLTSESEDESCGVTIQMKPLLQNVCKVRAIC